MGERWSSNGVKTRAQYGQRQGPRCDAERRARTTGQGHTAEYGGGRRWNQHVGKSRWRGRSEPIAQHRPAERSHDAGKCESAEHKLLNADARNYGCFAIASNGNEIAPKSGGGKNNGGTPQIWQGQRDYGSKTARRSGH